MLVDTQQAVAGALGGAAAQDIASYTQFNTISGDAALPIRSGIYLLTKGSAAAITLAAPVAADIGKRITVVAGSNFAHVVTSAAANIGDGTAGLNTTLTFAALIGACITLICNAANQWVTESIVQVTPAP